MKHSLYRIALLSCLLLVTSSAMAQLAAKADFTFQDTLGNTFSISNVHQLPAPLDTGFFKQYLTAASLQRSKQASSDSFYYTVTEIKMIKKRTIFDLRVHIVPKTMVVEAILKNSGYAHYRLKIGKRKQGRLPVLIEFLFGEI
ncbi:MAG: hypothetical protein NTW29_20750 [Bacteroidetes bacterium]|nr:hypothetical protein [Bacteroidota bacterium]